MTISRTVYNQLFEHTNDSKEQVIRLRPTEAKAGAVVMSSKHRIQMWTKDEHERFLEALEMFPSGPWKKIADHIGTKTPRQTMTHAQKYRQKIYRRQRGLRNQKYVNSDKMAVSPSGVADLNKAHGSEPQNSSAASAASPNTFGLLDILAHSAAAAQSGQSYPQGTAPPVAANGVTTEGTAQASAFPPPPAAAHNPQPPASAPTPSPPVPVSTMPPPPANSGNATPPSASPASAQSSPSGVARLCNSHLPPLAEILQLRGNQVGQQ